MRTTTSEPAAGSRHSSGPPPPPAPARTTWPHPGEQFEHKRAQRADGPVHAGRPRCQRCGRRPGRLVQCGICGIRVGPGCCLASERPPRCVSHREPDPEPEPEELKRTPSSSSSSSASSSPSCAQEAQLDCDFRVPRWFTCTQEAQSNCDLRVPRWFACNQESLLDCDLRVPRWFVCNRGEQPNCDLRVHRWFSSDAVYLDDVDLHRDLTVSCASLLLLLLFLLL